MLTTTLSIPPSIIGRHRSASSITPVETSQPAGFSPGTSPRDSVELSRQPEEPSSSDGVDDILRGMQSWDDPVPAKTQAPASKQGRLVAELVRAWEAPAARAVRGVASAGQATNPANSRCQQVAGGISTVSTAGSFVPIPHVQVAARGGQALGGVMTWVVCPLIDGGRRHTPEDISQIQEIRERLTRNPQPAAFPGAPRWSPSQPTNHGAGR